MSNLPRNRESCTVPEYLPDSVLLPDEHATEHTDDNLPDLTRPEEENKENGNQDYDTESRPLAAPVEQILTKVRGSACDRRPRQFLTYKSLDEPSVQSHAKVCSVAAHTAPYSPVVDAPHHTSYPHSLLPYIPPHVYAMFTAELYNQTPCMPYTYHTLSTCIPPTMLSC